MKDKFIIRESLNESAGWIAMWNGKKCEIKKDEAKDLWGAKQLAIKKLGVPKSKVGELALDVAFEDDEEGTSNAQFEDLKEDKDIEVKDVEKMAELEPGDEVEVTKEMDDVFDKSLEMTKEFGEEPKLETFDEQMDFLAKDEQEAIDGYEKVLALVEDEHVKEQLEKILVEEKAHKEFLEKVKKDKSLEYSHEEHEEEKEDSLTTSKDKVDEIPDSETDVFDSREEVIDDVFVDESCDDDFGFNHILDEEHKEAPIDWNDLDDLENSIKNADDDVLDDVYGKDTIDRKVVKGIKEISKAKEKHVCEKCGKEVCECDKLQEEDKPHTGHIKAKKPIELKARIEK